METSSVTKITPKQDPIRNTSFWHKHIVTILLFSSVFLFLGFMTYLALQTFYRTSKNAGIQDEKTNTLRDESQSPRIPSTQPEWASLVSTTCFISFDYPTSWTIDENREKNDAKDHNCYVRMLYHPDESTGFTFETGEENSVSYLLTLKLSSGEKTPITVAGADDAIRIYTTSVQDKPMANPVVSVFVRKGEKRYLFQYVESSSQPTEIFDRIIQSVKFTEKDTDYKEPFRQYGVINKTKDSIIINDLNLLSQALNLYYRDNKKYPFSLDKIAGVYMHEIPHDPYTGNSFGYETDGSTYYILRSSDGLGNPVTVDSRISPTPF